MYPGSPSRHEPRVRRRNPSVDSSEMRKRRRGSPTGNMEPSIPRRSSRGGDGGYGNGYSAPTPMSGSSYGRSSGSPTGQSNKTRRLYVGGLPSNVGLTDVALRQFFSALYVAGFRALEPGEPLPVVSAWLHHDGKFGFLELRGDQEAVNMMMFHGLELHRRALRISRPSDYNSEQFPAVANLSQDSVNCSAVVELCDQLNGIVRIPDDVLSAMQASAAKREENKDPQSSVPSSFKVENGSKRDPVAAGSSGEYSPDPGRTNGHTSYPETKSEMSIESKSDRADGCEKPSNTGTSSRSRNENIGGNVISLVNLVQNEDLEGSDEDYEDLVDDIKAECGQYGEVRDVNVPRGGQWKGTAFIEFTKTEYAELAVKELSKRVFDNRLISAEVVAGCATAASAAARALPETR